MKIRFLIVSSLLSLSLPTFPVLVRTVHAQAPLAKLTKVQQKVEVSSGAGSTFRAIAQGASIGRGSVVRTGRRSKADVKFSDGSLVRLGQLSSIEVRGPRNVQVGSGQALISWLNPGKIGTSYAAAEIKGTIVNIAVTDEGTTFTLYEGATEVVTATGKRQELKPGTEVFARPDGTLSGLRAAAPIFFAQAGSPIELLDSPKTGAFVGSVADIQVKAAPVRVAQREISGQAKAVQQTQTFNPGRTLPPPSTPIGGSPTNPSPTPPVTPNPTPTIPVPTPTNPPVIPTPTPTTPPIITTPTPTPTPKPNDDDDDDDDDDDKKGGKGKGKKSKGPKRGKESDKRVLDRASFSAGTAASITKFLNLTGADSNGVSGRVDFSIPLGARPRAADSARSTLVQLPPVPSAMGDEDALGVVRIPNELGFDSTRAQQRLDELTGVGGKSSGFDARAIGVLGDGGNSAYGARIRGYVARGNFLLDGAIQPLKARAGGQNFDLSAVSDLSLTYRTPKVEVQAGRQRFLSGPTQATLYGSLVRQGGREVMDAVRVSKPFGSMREQRLDLAYLVDAYPRNLPFRVSGLQQGFLARYSVQKKANVGLNAIKYFDLNRSNKLGVSLDAALPLGASGVDLYGELGRDTYGRNLSSVGLSFPGFYARTGFDVYLEAAYVGSSNNAARPPAEFALRTYRRVNDNVDLVGSLSRFSNGNTSALIGLSIGTKRSR